MAGSKSRTRSGDKPSVGASDRPGQKAAATPSRPRSAPRKSGTAHRPPPVPAAAGAVQQVVAPAWTAGIEPSLHHALRPVVGLFTPGRGGVPVVRPEDMLALRIATVGLRVQPGDPPRLERVSASGAAYLIVHHPPQAIAEQVFYEQQPEGVSTGQHDAPPATLPGRPAPSFPADNGVESPPIQARAAGESRVVFIWPPGYTCDYTLQGLLQAMQTLKMRVPAGARPRVTRPFVLPWPVFRRPLLPRKAGGASSVAQPAQATPSLRSGGLRQVTAAAHVGAATFQRFSLRQSLLAQRGDAAAEATLARRLVDLNGLGAGNGWELGAWVPPLLALKPKPALPAPDQTALELPWRLIVSPHDAEQWRHALQPVASQGTRHVELWHTRLLGAGAQPVEAPRPDGSRTLRAVWATTDRQGAPMQAEYPQGFGQLPTPDGPGTPFLGTLNDYDRYQFSHLSANFSTSYKPEPIDLNLLLLSSLGGWLDSRAEWEPEGLDVESWVHQASMGRDHYVRVVYRGVLFPFGHKAVLIKVSERKFHGQRAGNPAYLRQRMFMVVREREKSYLDAAHLQPFGAGNERVKNSFPFTHVRMLTTVTPDLAPPSLTQVTPPGKGQMLFWPAVGAGNKPPFFKFRMQATDLDGNPVQFELPLIFMSNSMASPRKVVAGKLKPLHANEGELLGAAQAAQYALGAWHAQTQQQPQIGDPPVADMKRQRVAMALSNQPGDTAVEVVHMAFGAHVPAQVTDGPNAVSFKAFKAWTPDLAKPMFFPTVTQAQVRVAAMAQLTGSEKFNQARWNPTYLAQGFGSGNTGEVFLDLPETADMAKLDFGKQSDRSGGFVMPNLQPSALSRLLGPVAGDVSKVVQGKVEPTGFFPPGGIGDLPLPLLFGCIPLSAIFHEVDNLADKLGEAPKFASSAASQVEQFFSGLMQLYQMVGQLASQPARLAGAGLAVVDGTLATLKAQAAAYGAQGNAVRARIDTARTTLATLAGQLDTLAGHGFEMPDPLAGINLGAAQAPNGSLRTQLQALKTEVDGASVVPAGFRQQVSALLAQALAVCDAIGLFTTLYAHGKQLFDALRSLLDNPAPGQSLGELLGKPELLQPRLEAVKNALGAVKADVQALPLLDGPARQTLVSAIDVAQQAFAAAEFITNLLGEELVIRFDWTPRIKSWSLDGSNDYLFRVHDDKAFIVAVEARVKKSGGAPRIQVLCGLRHFDLVLIAPASFIELNFEKIEFTVDSGAKMNVDVLLSDIKFVGPLSFVEVLKDFIPLDGFSDPPYLDITPQGIDAGFDISLPTIACGVLNLSNVSLGAGFTVPFIGQPLSVRFNFCTREQPFHLTVYCFGGGGFFGVTIDPRGVQILEAAFEFGAAISVDFGVASGGVSVMAGIYFRMEADAASLTGYFRLEGHVDVMGLITASLELYLELRYEFESGKAVGKASLTIEIEVLIFSGSVTITCEKKFAGSNGDPTLRQLLGLSADPALPLEDELAAIQSDTAYGWRDYCEAFA